MHMQGPSHAVTAACEWDVQSQQRWGHRGARSSAETLWCVFHAMVPLGTGKPSCSSPQQQPLEETELWGMQFKGRKLQLFGDTPCPTLCTSQTLGKSWVVRMMYNHGKIPLRDRAKRHPQPKGTSTHWDLGAGCASTQSPAEIPHFVPCCLLTAPLAFPPRPASDSSAL